MPYAGDVAVFRLLSGSHFYTVDCNEAQTLIRQLWAYEGVQCYVASAPAAGLSALYRFVLGGGMHFYTADETEKDQVLANGGTLEGTMGYVSSASTADTVPLYRGLDPNSGDHFYTTDQNEWQNLLAAGWRNEGITGFVSNNNLNNCQAVQDALDAVNSDKAHLQAYYDCLNSQGFNIGNFLNMITSFASQDLGGLADSILQANKDAVKSQGCLALLNPAQRQAMIAAQAEAQRRWFRMHPGVGV